MMIRLVVNCVTNLGLPLQCLDLNMLWWWVLPDGGKQISLWGNCWRFLSRGSREWSPWHIAAIVFLFSMVLPCLCNDESDSDHAHNMHTMKKEGGRRLQRWL